MRSAALIPCLLLALLPFGAGVRAEETARGDSGLEKRISDLEKSLESASYDRDAMAKKVDDVLWFQRVGDVAEIDKVYLVGPPNPKGEETYGIKNERHPFKF